MPDQIQTTTTRPEERVKLKTEPVHLPELIETSGVEGTMASVAAADHSVDSLAARLGDERLHVEQRRALAIHAGQAQGNHHLQRAMAMLRRDSPQDQNTFVQRQGNPPYMSGASLPSPSYVAGTPSSTLAGGPTASAGDSYFVTGGQQGQLLNNAKRIRDIYKAIDDVAKKLQEKGAGGFLGYGKDDQLLTCAKNLQGLASGLLKLASAIDSWTGSPNKESIEKGSKAVEYVDKLIKAAEMVGSVQKLSAASEEMDKKTNQATVEAWADSVGDTFDKAGALLDLIPMDGLPGFFKDYWKGLFSAPKNYISAFKVIMHARYDKLDMEIGYNSATMKSVNWGTNKTEWEGELSGMYTTAYFQPKSKDGLTLTTFMTNHRNSEGLDLYKAQKAYGVALLLGAISRDAPEDVKDAWAAYVGSA